MAHIGTVFVEVKVDVSAFSETLTRELLTEAIAAQLMRHLPRSVGLGDLRAVAAALQDQFTITPKATESKENDGPAGNT